MGLHNPPKNNQFRLKIPKGFFPQDIKEKYDELIKAEDQFYVDLENYITSEIQTVSFPSFRMATVDQVNSTSTNFPLKNQGGFNAYRQMERKINIEFRHVDGFVTYFAMLETFLALSTIKSQEDLERVRPGGDYPSFSLQIFNAEEILLTEMVYDKIIFTDISQMTMNYTQVTNQNQTFTCGFEYEGVDISFGLDKRKR